MRSSRWMLCFLFLSAPLVRADDWAQWLGPKRDATTSEIVAPWKGDLKVLWRQPVGEGHSAPIVSGGKVYVHAKVAGKDEEEVTALDASTGNVIWQANNPRTTFTSPFGVGPRATPTASGNRIYTLGVTGVLSCLDDATGKSLWRVDTQRVFQTPPLTFGVACSPLVDEKAVYVNVGSKGASVVAFDKQDGKVLWKSQDDRASYSSPIFLRVGDRRLVIFLTQKGVIALEPSSGDLAWSIPFQDALSESSTTPVAFGDNLLVSSVTLGSLALALDKANPATPPATIWKTPALTCYFSTPVVVGQDQLYMVTGQVFNAKAVLRCVDPKDGKLLWSKPTPGKYHASLMRTGDQKLLMLEEGGSLVLVDPNRTEYRELARSKACGETWAHPALANGRLYVRDKKELICLQLKGD